jgi:hypothetical protein
LWFYYCQSDEFVYVSHALYRVLIEAFSQVHEGENARGELLARDLPQGSYTFRFQIILIQCAFLASHRKIYGDFLQPYEAIPVDYTGTI